MKYVLDHFGRPACLSQDRPSDIEIMDLTAFIGGSLSRLRLLLMLSLAFTVATTCRAQLPNETDTTATPAAGDHDYLQSPVEIVNPANGSVSVRIPIPVAPGRQFTLPFSIAYDSNGAFYITGGPPGYGTSLAATGAQGGWSYTYPMISYSATTWTIPDSNDHLITCHGSYNYVYQDPNGNRHNLGLSVSANVASPDGYDNCSNGVEGDGEATTGGEGAILATTSVPTGNTGTFPAVYVSDPDGTGYSIPSKGAASGGTFLVLAATDRNGNTVSINQTGGSLATNQITYVDTIGRTALSVSGIGGNPDTINSEGLSAPYKVYWTTASASFTDNMVNLEPGVDPNCPTAMSASSTVISQIVLPNGQGFSFSYDPTYGMLTKVVYPGGGYVRYVWGLNLQAEAGTFHSSTQGWACRYDFPAVTDRYVSYDGVTEALHQNFTYSTQWSGSSSTSWTTKRTIVKTTDNIRSASFSTTYTYSPLNTSYVPNCPSCALTAQVPVESTIQYNDFGGQVLQTISKSWKNVRLVQTVQTTAGSSSSLKVYCYSTWEQPTEIDEYDWGGGSPTGSCASVSSGTSAGALLKKTATSYAGFSDHIVDRPSSIITYDGSSNRVNETDYPSYDSVGNLLTKTVDCFTLGSGQACAQGNSTTTYTYDSNGQMLTLTDPNGNPATQFSYKDSYTSCGGNAPVDSPSDAYLTQITNPGGQSVSFCYDYSAGRMLTSTDQSSNKTSYAYQGSTGRLAEVNYPDNGVKQYSYNDSPPAPTMTTTTQINSSQQAVSTNVMNGLGAVDETELTSDPYGSDLQVTTLDGTGRPYMVTTPYRSTSDPTYGTTTYTYDALGRTTAIKNADGKSSSTQYSGNCATDTDAAGRARKSCSDGLGRLTSVFEDPTGLNYETDYTYDGNNNLVRVDQWGGAKGNATERVRTFSYDSMSKLTNACNPESAASGAACSASGPWTNTYSYDRNSNVLTKSDTRGITVNYSYDALNRVTSKTYSGDPNGTPSSCYQYDLSSIPNGIGRLSNSWTQHAGAACAASPSAAQLAAELLTLKSIQSYDTMGRETGELQCTPSKCSATSGPTVSLAYDLMGNPTSLSNSVGAGGSSLGMTYSYDNAGRPSSASSNWTAFPTNLFNVGQSNAYNPAGQLQNWLQGSNLTVTQGYTNRLWVNSVVGTGQIP